MQKGITLIKRLLWTAGREDREGNEFDRLCFKLFCYRMHVPILKFSYTCAPRIVLAPDLSIQLQMHIQLRSQSTPYVTDRCLWLKKALAHIFTTNNHLFRQRWSHPCEVVLVPKSLHPSPLWQIKKPLVHYFKQTQPASAMPGSRTMQRWLLWYTCPACFAVVLNMEQKS